MPQLNPLDWAPQLIWLLITFGMLYLLMVYVALPRIGSVIEARADRIAKDLAQAEAKQKAHAIVEAGRAKLKEETAAERAKLDRQLGKKGAEAEARIAEAKTSAMREVNAVAADVAADIVRQLIGVAPAKAEIDQAVQAARKD
jgi:F-type H+-transporting ATPase subunit b